MYKRQAGDGGGEYYEPTVAQTALRGKKWEGDVASAAVSTTNANMIDVKPPTLSSMVIFTSIMLALSLIHI